MPELPEVEVTRLSFVDQIARAHVQGVRLGKPLRWPLGCSPQQLVGSTVLGVRRRGKYLLIDLDQGLLLVHLGMSGHLSFSMSMPPAGPHDHFDLHTSQGTLRLHDPRRFGAVVFAADEQSPMAQKLLGGLGVEPLAPEFEAQGFYTRLKKKKSAIKQVLLAGDVVVGVGNIYASESLFLAGIRPTTKAYRLSQARVVRLRDAIVQVLSQALALGGSTLKDFVSAQGAQGYFQLQAHVYGRQGEPCRVCGTTIRLLRQGQRSTFYCSTCQKP